MDLHQDAKEGSAMPEPLDTGAADGTQPGGPVPRRVLAIAAVIVGIIFVATLAAVANYSARQPDRQRVLSPRTSLPGSDDTAPAATPPAPGPPAPPLGSSTVPLPAPGAGPFAPSTSATGRATPPPAAHPVAPALPPAPNCYNSHDPACGLLVWFPAPAANQPASATITFSPPAPVANAEVTITVVESDPDASPNGCRTLDFGDGSSAIPPMPHTDDPHMYGPWAPPPAIAGSHAFTFTHTYKASGTYTVAFGGDTGSWGRVADDCEESAPDPYQSHAAVQGPVVVG